MTKKYVCGRYRHKGAEKMSTGNGLAAVRLQTGRQPEQLFYLTKPITSIGRDQYSDIVVADHAVSYKHALIKREGAQWRIQKAKPDVTLTVNQKPVDETVIEFNDHISLGPYTQLLFIDPTDTVKAPDPATAHRRKMPFLEVSISSWPGREVHPLDKPLINIGRDSSNDIVIPSP